MTALTSRLLVATLAGLAIASNGCTVAGADPEVDGEPAVHGDDYAAESISSHCNRAFVTSHAGSRAHIMNRALRWVDQRVPYSQSRWHEGYRQDCSGFVSMAWELGSSYVTWTLPERSHHISWDQLQPGDALDRTSTHVMLFAGWTDSSHNGFCAVEEHATGRPAEITYHQRHDSWMTTGFQPYRKNGL